MSGGRGERRSSALSRTGDQATDIPEANVEIAGPGAPGTLDDLDPLVLLLSPLPLFHVVRIFILISQDPYFS